MSSFTLGAGELFAETRNTVTGRPVDSAENTSDAEATRTVLLA